MLFLVIVTRPVKRSVYRPCTSHSILKTVQWAHDRQAASATTLPLRHKLRSGTCRIPIGSLLSPLTDTIVLFDVVVTWNET